MYKPAKIWQAPQMGGKFGATNRPSAGARHEQALPRGKHDYQLYSLNTPNGIKVNILLNELVALGEINGFDAFKIDILQGAQFGTDFVDINPNSKIPALVDYSTSTPVKIFESGAILLYLAQKHGVFLPKDSHANAQTLSWLMWQMGSAPFVGGGFGHFYAYAPQPIEYAIDRYAMETKRQLDVLDKHLANHTFMVGSEYTIADMAIWPWYGQLALGKLYVTESYNAYEFLQIGEYTNVVRWAEKIYTLNTVAQAVDLPLASID